MTSLYLVSSYVLGYVTYVTQSYGDAVVATTVDEQDYRYIHTVPSCGLDSDSSSAFVVSIESAYYDPVAAFSTKEDAEVYILLAEIDGLSCEIKEFDITP